MADTCMYSDDYVTLYCGDSRQFLDHLGIFDAVITDPPYGQTALPWDRWVPDWPQTLPTQSLWTFGSLRMFMAHAHDFRGWTLSQDLIWRKQNGTGFMKDRFRRVHEQVAHFYRGKWTDLYHVPPVTLDAKPKMVPRRTSADHLGKIGGGAFSSVAGGPRLQRSVLEVRNEHHRAVHPTQKPLGILFPLIEYAVPLGGVLLDPFAGSGSTLLAARQLRRKAVGIEISPESCQAAIQRLRAVA